MESPRTTVLSCIIFMLINPEDGIEPTTSRLLLSAGIEPEQCLMKTLEPSKTKANALPLSYSGMALKIAPCVVRVVLRVGGFSASSPSASVLPLQTAKSNRTPQRV